MLISRKPWLSGQKPSMCLLHAYKRCGGRARQCTKTLKCMECRLDGLLLRMDCRRQSAHEGPRESASCSAPRPRWHGRRLEATPSPLATEYWRCDCSCATRKGGWRIRGSFPHTHQFHRRRTTRMTSMSTLGTCRSASTTAGDARGSSSARTQTPRWESSEDATTVCLGVMGSHGATMRDSSRTTLPCEKRALCHDHLLRQQE